MATIAIIGIAIIGVYLSFMLIFKHKLALNKFTIIILAVCIGYLVISNNLNKDKPGVTQQAPTYQLIAPDIARAPYVVATPSRVYYSSLVSDNGKVVTLVNYYTYDKKNWQLVQRELPLDRELYGDIKIYKR